MQPQLSGWSAGAVCDTYDANDMCLEPMAQGDGSNLTRYVRVASSRAGVAGGRSQRQKRTSCFDSLEDMRMERDPERAAREAAETTAKERTGRRSEQVMRQLSVHGQQVCK